MNNKDLLIEQMNNFRQGCLKGDNSRDAGLATELPEVKRINNIKYGKDDKWNLLDIYLPKQEKEVFPVVINIHGGGWVYGTKETYQFYGLNFAKNGFAFVNPNYKLAPDVVYPQELNQVDEYMHWIDDHAEEYHLDRNNVFITGDSAGGQMAEQYVAIVTNPKYRKIMNYKNLNLKFRAVALNSAACFMMEPNATNGFISLYFTDTALKNHSNDLNVEKYITSDFLPTYLTTGKNDPLHDNQFMLAGFLKAKNVPVIVKNYGDSDHEEGHVFLINQKDPIANQANKDEMNFFKKYQR